jgi:hypothetical protein
MIKMKFFVGTLLASASTTQAAPIPDAVAAMLDAAAGDPTQLKIVADIAKKRIRNQLQKLRQKLPALPQRRPTHARKS